jgi:RHS repeat-associated protein
VLEVRKDPGEPVLEQYVWDVRYVDAPVVRWHDLDDDGNFEDANEVLYYTNDANMNVTALVNTDGDVAERYMYDPYGKVTVLNGVVDAEGNDTSEYEWTERTEHTFENEVLYTGQRFDGESGLYLFRNRYHDPSLGRFISRDPTEYEDGMNLYEYVGASPIFYVDWAGAQKQRADARGAASKPALPQEYQPGLPPVIPSGDAVEIHIKRQSLLDVAGGLCGEITIKQIQNLKLNLKWRDLKGDGTGCDFFKKLVSDDEIKKLMNDALGKKQEKKCRTKFLGMFGENYKCCNKAKFDGTYPVELVIHPIWLAQLVSREPICELSGSITATVTATGEIGTCFKVN